MDSTTENTLRRFPPLLEAHFALVPASHRNWRPPSWAGCPSEHFPAIGQICHVRDIETDGYNLRFRRMLTELHPSLPSLDGYALAEEREYAKADPAEVFRAIRHARAQTLDLLGAVRDEEWLRTADFAGHGVVTLRSLVHYLCTHDQQHLAGVQWLLAQIAADIARRERLSA